jgi:uncharacterized protein with HEPN domain
VTKIKLKQPHKYFGIDTTIVWQIIKNDIPVLKEKIDEILKSLE